MFETMEEIKKIILNCVKIHSPVSISDYETYCKEFKNKKCYVDSFESYKIDIEAGESLDFSLELKDIDNILEKKFKNGIVANQLYELMKFAIDNDEIYIFWKLFNQTKKTDIHFKILKIYMKYKYKIDKIPVIDNDDFKLIEQINDNLISVID